MNDERDSFEATVAEVLGPVLEPRGFEYQPSSQPQNGQVQVESARSVLFHCDGPEAVTALLERFPTLEIYFRDQYADQEIVCLDLWVSEGEAGRTWSFEGLERSVEDIAGDRAAIRLQELQSQPVEAWAAQLAAMLDVYFSELEESP